MRVISQFADNAKNAIEQKDVRPTGEMAAERPLEAGRVGGKWQRRFSMGTREGPRRGDNQKQPGSLLAIRGTTQERLFQIIV